MCPSAVKAHLSGVEETKTTIAPENGASFLSRFDMIWLIYKLNREELTPCWSTPVSCRTESAGGW